jgi:hypothetical protein
MQLDGIHHITCIMADAPRNVYVDDVTFVLESPS